MASNRNDLRTQCDQKCKKREREGENFIEGMSWDDLGGVST